jgi:hypothetical protein
LRWLQKVSLQWYHHKWVMTVSWCKRMIPSAHITYVHACPQTYCICLGLWVLIFFYFHSSCRLSLSL